MTPCTLSFPCSIGDRVFNERLRKVGTIIGLQKCEGSGPKAFFEYLTKAEEVRTVWVWCDTLRDTQSKPVTPDLSKLAGVRLVPASELPNDMTLTIGDSNE